MSYILTVALMAVSALGRSVAALLLGTTALPRQRGLKNFQCQTWSPLRCQTTSFILSDLLGVGTHFTCSCLQVSLNREEVIPF